MLARLSTSTDGKKLPQEWLDMVSLNFNNAYDQELVKMESSFHTFGFIYAEEWLYILSAIPLSDINQAATSCFISIPADEMSTSQKIKLTQDWIQEVWGMFFDEVFAGEDTTWEPDWQEVTHKNRTAWYKLSRENVVLTIEADDLLKKSGFFSKDDMH